MQVDKITDKLDSLDNLKEYNEIDHDKLKQEMLIKAVHNKIDILFELQESATTILTAQIVKDALKDVL